MDARLIGAFMIAPMLSVAGIESFSVLKNFAPYNYIVAVCLFIGAIWCCAETIRLERGVTSSALYRSMFLAIAVISVVCFGVVVFVGVSSMS